MTRAVVAAAIAIVCAASISPAHAQIVNGSFGTGDLTGWSATGFTAVESYSTGPTADGYFASFQINPSTGTYEALAATDYLDPVAPDPVSGASLESFAGLASGSLGAVASPDTADDGSAIKQTFTVSSAGNLSFDYDFLTNEIYPPVNNDFAFYALGSGTDMTPIKLADTNSTLVPVPGGLSAPYAAQTGFQSVSVALGPGTYTLALGAVNANDDTVSSCILVDNVAFSGSTPPPPTPEPGAFALAGSGALAAAAALRRRSRAR
jgi:hypothetical protein